MPEWVITENGDLEHCGKPAYWEGEEAFCSKCQTRQGECACSGCMENADYSRLFCQNCFDNDCSESEDNC